MKNKENNELTEIKFSEEELMLHDKCIRNRVIFNSFIYLLVILFLLFILCITFFSKNNPFLPNSIKKFLSIVDLYETSYMQEVSIENLIDGAIYGLVSGSEDKYGGYISIDKSATTGKRLSVGGYYGLGITYVKDKDSIKITDIVRGSPADKAGLEVGSVVEYINGEPVNSDMLEQFSKDIQEKVITEFTFRLDTEEEITMVTENIDVPKVDFFIKDDIGYISIYTFVPDTFDLFKEAIDNIVGSNVKELVIDLRNNSGGELETAVSMLDYITEDELLVKLDYKNNKVFNDEERYSDSFCAIDKKLPISIIVNENTASAAELTTMVLQDIYNAKVYGKTTFGKSTILSVYEFNDKSMLLMSVGLYLPPSERIIEEEGITPNVIINDDDLEKEVDYLYEKYIKRE